MQDMPHTWDLRILHDASGGQATNKYDWGDLTWARPVAVVPPLEIAEAKGGEPRDVSFANSTMVPVLSQRATDVVRDLANDEIELIPANVHGQTEDFYVMNVLSEVKCLDETRTQYFKKWTEDSEQPHRAGDYRMIEGLVINPDLAVGHNIFRLWGWNVATIVSAAIKEAFDREGFTGAVFMDVCSPKPSLAEVAAARKKMRQFYEDLLFPVTERYGPVKSILRAIVGFDGGGPVAMCVLDGPGDAGMTACVTCELAVRQTQKPCADGRFELLTVCDDRQWAQKVLTLVGKTSMNSGLDIGHTVDLSPALKMPGALDAVLLEPFSKRRIDGCDYSLLRCVGISSPELAFAKQAGIESLRLKLIQANVFNATPCRRPSVV